MLRILYHPGIPIDIAYAWDPKWLTVLQVYCLFTYNEVDVFVLQKFLYCFQLLDVIIHQKDGVS